MVGIRPRHLVTESPERTGHVSEGAPFDVHDGDVLLAFFDRLVGTLSQKFRQNRGHRRFLDERHGDLFPELLGDAFEIGVPVIRRVMGHGHDRRAVRFSYRFRRNPCLRERPCFTFEEAYGRRPGYRSGAIEGVKFGPKALERRFLRFHPGPFLLNGLHRALEIGSRHLPAGYHRL